ncbi:MAG: SCO family protein [Rhodospirillales bacterium]|nr:SCO family protein [Rhodospirillales bacterium]
MKNSRLFLLCSLVGLVLAVSVSGPIYSAADDDSMLARYGQYGGPFSLVDHHGKIVTDRDFLGQYVLIFFGYTYCPDVCPTTMQVIGDALDALGEKGRNIQPVFVSVDPERDTPAELAGYVSHFHPRMIGLSGTKDQILKLADDYGASYFKVYQMPSTDAADDTEDGKSDYLISHSAALYLMGPDGKFITLFPFGTSSGEIAQGVSTILEPASQ